MPVNLSAPDPAMLNAVRGVELGVAMAGVRKANRRDVTVVKLAEGCSVAGVFTANRFCAAPVLLCREHLASGQGMRAILVNTGNANAGTGADGLARARSTCAALAGHLGVAPQQVLPFPPASSWRRCRTSASKRRCRRRWLTPRAPTGHRRPRPS